MQALRRGRMVVLLMMEVTGRILLLHVLSTVIACTTPPVRIILLVHLTRARLKEQQVDIQEALRICMAGVTILMEEVIFRMVEAMFLMEEVMLTTVTMQEHAETDHLLTVLHPVQMDRHLHHHHHLQLHHQWIDIRCRHLQEEIGNLTATETYLLPLPIPVSLVTPETLHHHLHLCQEDMIEMQGTCHYHHHHHQQQPHHQE